MPISKIGSKALVDCSVAAVDIADNSITAAKLAGSIANAKLANSSVTINNTSVSLGASANIAVLDWQSIITADGSTSTTGVAGRGYFINTTSAAHTFTLPTSATRGDTIAIKDYAGTFGTNKLTIARNGHNIQGVANNSLIQTNRASVVLVYADVTRGWEFVTESNVADLQEKLYVTATGGTILTSTDYKTHVFTGDSTFVVSCAGNASGSNTVDYLVVAGGGGGAAAANGAGGAGGFRLSNSTFSTPNPLASPTGLPVSATTYPITVGGGGPGGSPGCVDSSSAGSPSTFSTITSAGGSRAKGVSPGAGGSGGGGCAPGSGAGGAGNTPPVSPPQGNPGGSGGANYGSGGGGGAGAAGSNGNNSPGGGPGGVGSFVPDSFFGPTAPSYGTPGPAPAVRYFSGGGGGGTYITSTGGTGGSGGGGDGRTPGPGLPYSGPGSNATANTGGGGGGGFHPGGLNGAGTDGGKGIVIIRYKFQN